MFELANPWVLILLPVPLFLWFCLPRTSIQLPAALKVPFFNAMQGIVEQEKRSLTKQTTLTFLSFIWFLLIFALAGPRWIGKAQPLTREGHNIMLVLDLSPSMEINDMMWHNHPTTRLDVVKRAATRFVQDRPRDKIGLILFGERAYLQTPLTYDHQNILQRLDDATAGLAGQTTSIGDALGLAVKQLQTVPKKGRVIILLTDGANNSGVLAPLKSAELASGDHMKIYTIGLGSDIDPQSFNGMFLNMNVSADLDEDTLKAIAKMTRGRYFRATDMQSLETVYQAINRMEIVSQDEETFRPQYDYYAWPLSIAWLLFMYLLADRGGLIHQIKYHSVRSGRT